MRKESLISGVFVLIAAMMGCGPSVSKNSSLVKEPTVVLDEDRVIVRGRWILAVNQDDEADVPNALAMAVSGSQPVTGTVAASTQFELSNSNFSTPVSDGVASYGTLDVTDLSDNDLKVCGSNGNQKCTVGALRVYTTGKPGAGLWDDVQAYGLPMLTGSNVIGLDAAGATVLASVTIPSNKHKLRLSDFTSSASFAIPISVDFSEAGAGSFSTTLVVEYVLLN